MLGDDFEDVEHDAFVTYGRNERRNARRDEDRLDHNVGSIKMKIPHFQGKNDHDAYLEWKRRWNMFLIAITIPVRKGKISCC